MTARSSSRASAAPKQGSADVLGARALNRATLERQMLLSRHRLSALEAVERLVGMQSQAPIPPYFGLWTRLEGFAHEELSRLVREREVVRIALMRSTIHLVSARDCRGLRPLMQPVLERAFLGTYGKHLADVDADALAAAGRALVEEEPRTFAELGARLAERWPGREPAALSGAVRTRVPLVQVPPRGLWGESGQAAHTSAEAWLGGPLDAEPSPEEMVLRYLAAFGPASVKDAQVWSGLTRLREVVEPLRPRLRTFRDERGAELFDLPDAPRPHADTPAPPRFMAEWDNLFLSHADRARVVPERHRARIFTINGVMPATVLVDGFVAGIWKIARSRGAATLLIEPLDPLAAADRDALAEEGARLLAFAASDAETHDIQFTDSAD
jgi:Winged helix DNA-binding domain